MTKINLSRDLLERLVGGVCEDIYDRDIPASAGAEEIMALFDRMIKYPIELNMNDIIRK